MASPVLLIRTVLLFIAFAVSGIVHSAPLPAPPQLSATSFLLVDYDSGRVIAGKNEDERIEPASLTKMLTAYVVSVELERGSISLDDEVIISEFAQSMPGSRMFVESGKTVKLIDLLKGLIIQSGNDASVALAEHIAASENGFADMMNQTATLLGMTNSNFINASGLPHPDHYTTASDLATLSRALIRDFPEEYKLYAVKEYEFNDIPQRNRNSLLWRDDSVDGIKTGHTEAAGYCLVGSAVRDNMRLISVILGTNSEKTRAAESQQLLNYGFRFFKTGKVYSAGDALVDARVWMGSQKTLPLGVEKDVYLTLPREQFDAISSQLELSDYIKAPIRKGQPLGRSILTADGQAVGEVPLVSLQKVDEGGFFTRMKDSIMRHFQ